MGVPGVGEKCTRTAAALDTSLRLELSERLADDGAGDTEVVGDLEIPGNLVAGREACGADPDDQRVPDLLVQRQR